MTYRDDEEKIRRTQIGIITGAGSTELLDRVESRLLLEEIQYTDQIRDIVVAESSDILSATMTPLHRELTRGTTWLFTYIGAGSSHQLDERLSAPGLRMAVTGPTLGFETMIYLPGQVGILWPHGVEENRCREIHDFCETRLRMPTDENESPVEDIAHHVAAIAEAITQMAHLSKSVSARFQFGIHTIAHDIGLTGISSGDGDIEFSWVERHLDEPS